MNANILTNVNLKELILVFASVEIGESIQGRDPLKGMEAIENAIYSLLFTYLETKNTLVNGNELKYYAMAIVQSIISQAVAEALLKALGEGDTLKTKEVIKSAFIKYVEVLVGHVVVDLFIGDEWFKFAER